MLVLWKENKTKIIINIDKDYGYVVLFGSPRTYFVEIKEIIPPVRLKK